MPTELTIRRADAADFEAIWPIFSEIVSAGRTYVFAPDTDKEQAREIWMHTPAATYVAEQNSDVLGTYYIKPNQPGLGAHVCNCGYMVASRARGQGVATAMCRHSQQVAREMGFMAMQFNFVVASNVSAIRLWEKLGFSVVGRLPMAFRNSGQEFEDALIMYKIL